MITRKNQTVTCPKCKISQNLANRLFDDMIKFPWIAYLSGTIIPIPLKCPKCKHNFTEKFIFTEK